MNKSNQYRYIRVCHLAYGGLYVTGVIVSAYVRAILVQIFGIQALHHSKFQLLLVLLKPDFSFFHFLTVFMYFLYFLLSITSFFPHYLIDPLHLIFQKDRSFSFALSKFIQQPLFPFILYGAHEQDRKLSLVAILHILTLRYLIFQVKHLNF